MTQNLRGKVALITGGGTGIGRCTALLLAKRGAKIVLVGRRPTPLEETAKQICGEGGTAIALPCDITSDDAPQKVVEAACTSFGTIDILINNAGHLLWRDIQHEEISNFEHLIRINYLSAVRLTKAVFPLLVQKRSGSIVNISSILGRFAVADSAAYAASKFALSGFTDALRIEVARFGIHVMEVNPGLIDTAMTEIFFQEDQAYRRRSTSPERVAAAIVRGIEKRKDSVMIPWYVRLIIALRWTFPGISNWIMKRTT